ncbi:uncharacterized protein Z520_00905 [Fonsecaea multimorphosa CBS 102226]|uniref:Uncharacterized protein n=1 Tax=Fonsecaea multimorphosa CBS 102226 TaxID=1442371 RepID=A0A0D2J433_9EURO|nr:uncharacterized protein Z520_00905 [Fonsecaea multimorphosa CBS 102226]KIY04212.1 hypothetical protein Z520_00905 [Fonsecaea multimorphosa CBS 102226]OAL32038.1 hypothetical protein AYO22_00908 [Fonsecaea multimorphosa]
MSTLHSYGVTLPNGCTIVHGQGANIKHPFSDIPVEMHELDPGSRRAFSGQMGFIEFSTDFRLPRHVHIAASSSSSSSQPVVAVQKFIAERIVVLNGVALVELNGEIYVIPPQTLVTIAPGVPHTWTACPPGVSVPVSQGPTMTTGDPLQVIQSEGTFLMLYEYEEPTAFFPTRQTATLASVDDYERCDDLETIRIPSLSADQVRQRCWFVCDRTVRKPG